MSRVEVDKIQQQCGSTLTVGGGASKTVTVDATTVTLGRCGGTVSLASGATQSGFGRTGTVDWVTDSIKTATFTAVSGKGYFCNTAGGAFEVDLPAGSAGSIVSIQDYNNTFDSNSLTIDPNGSEKINGGAGSVILSTEGQGLTLVYIDSTVGWRSIEEQSYAQQGSDNLIATGGTITTSGDYKIHTFTGPGTFTVCAISATAADNTVSYLVVAGGGAGGGAASFGGAAAGGGGAGGFREYRSPVSGCYAVSPLNGAPSITVTAQGYPITVGGGGAIAAPGDGIGGNGNPSIFSTVTSTAGGGGAGIESTSPVCGNIASPGGSGGGSGADKCSPGSGNTPPTTPSQGSNGGSGTQGGGGGGATAVGGPAANPGQQGGAGATTSISGSPTAYAGGGGGGNGTHPGGTGGTGGGGAGGNPGPNPGVAGTANTGGGGGGGPTVDSAKGGAGGSGIVIIRYKYQ